MVTKPSAARLDSPLPPSQIKAYAKEVAPEVLWSERVRRAKQQARTTGQAGCAKPFGAGRCEDFTSAYDTYMCTGVGLGIAATAFGWHLACVCTVKDGTDQ